MFKIKSKYYVVYRFKNTDAHGYSSAEVTIFKRKLTNADIVQISNDLAKQNGFGSVIILNMIKVK